MLKRKLFALIACAAVALLLFAGCAAWFTKAPAASPALPDSTATPAQAATPEIVPASPSPAASVAPAENDAALAAYFRENYDLDYAEAAYVDLTHDGKNELIVVEMLDEDIVTPLALSSVTEAGAFRAGHLKVFSLANGAVTQIYEREAHHAHAGWMQLYLYEDETGAYLFDYSPSVFQGYADYIFALFSLDASGGMAMKESKSLSFIVNPLPNGFDYVDSSNKDVTAQVKAFEQQAQTYIKKSQPLLVYFEDLDGTILFDYLNRELHTQS